MLALKAGGLLLGGPTGLFRWDSIATAWQAVSLPAQGAAVDVRALYEDARGMVLAGTERNGVFASFDDGITWSAANDGLTADGVFSFAVDSEGRIVAGTSAGLFRATINPR
jgi:ligand-binding sensor domain-containing protein